MLSFDDAKNLIATSQNICILPSKNLQGDVLGAALALSYTLRKINKDVNLCLEKIPEKLQFLDDEQFNNKNNNSVISIETLGKEIKEMRYEKNGREMKIYLTCQKGAIEEKDICFQPETGFINETDLLITLGVKNFEDLNPSKQEIKLFHNAPVLNIDNQASNANFGEVNLINLISSLSEISTQFIKSINENLLDANIATPLLAGIISFSQNLKSPKTRPRTFETASYLIEKGANHQKIIQHLYKTKPLSQIKLLGRVLEKLGFNEKKQLHQILLTKKDFQNTGTTSKDLSFIIEELRSNFWIPASLGSDLLILWESHASENLIKGIFYSLKPDFRKTILDNFQGISQGNRALFVIREKDLRSAQEKILKIL